MNFPDLHRFPYFAYDTESTGLVYKVDKMFAFSLSTPDGKDYYFDIRETPMAVEWLRDSLSRSTGIIIMANASFDVKMSSEMGIDLPLDQCDDVIIRASCIDEHLYEYSLDNLSSIYLDERKISSIYQALADLFGGLGTRNVQMKNLHRAPPNLVAPYAKQDTRLTLKLWEWQNEEILRQSLEKIIDFERNKMPTFIRAEMRGIRIDKNEAHIASDKLVPLIYRKQKELEKIIGFEVNVNSPKQIKEIFEPIETKFGWQTKYGEQLGTTEKGNPSLKADYLREMKAAEAKLIIDIRSMIKTKDTFLLGHILGHATGDRVYPTINQTKNETGGTGTGRLSYQEPAMQQIPSRNKEVAKIVKTVFLPDEGMIWVDSDMNSFEVRVFAHLVNNPMIIEAYRKNPQTDFHQFVADLTHLVRNAEYSGQPNAKQLNLSMIFNSGNGAIADKMGMPWRWESFTTTENGKEKEVVYKKAGREAMDVIEKYHRKIPGIKTLAEKAATKAKNRGYIFTYTGRRLRFPNGYKAYKASGLLIQATAADINKENWKSVEDALGEDGHMILNTHDSYSMCIQEDWKPAYERVKKEIEKPKLRVPLLLDLNGHGSNWWEALQKR